MAYRAANPDIDNERRKHRRNWVQPQHILDFAQALQRSRLDQSAYLVSYVDCTLRPRKQKRSSNAINKRIVEIEKLRRDVLENLVALKLQM